MTNIQGSVQACPPRHARGTHKPLSSAQSRAQECESPHQDRRVNTEGTIKIVVRAVTGLVIGLAFGLVWHLFEPSQALYFWPVLGAVIFGQHAYHSNLSLIHISEPTR